MEVFEQVREALRSGDADAGFDLLIERFREEKSYPLIFEARLMKKRNELGLPLIQTEPFNGLEDGVQASYEEATIAAAREVGVTKVGVPRATPLSARKKLAARRVLTQSVGAHPIKSK